jgi:hypothetical protein
MGHGSSNLDEREKASGYPHNEPFLRVTGGFLDASARQEQSFMAFNSLTRRIAARVSRHGRLYSTASDAPVLVEINGPQANLTLNRPRTGNALSSDMIVAMANHLGELEANDKVRSIVLTGKGRFFCTGMDLGVKGEGMAGQSGEQYDRGKLPSMRVLDRP